MITKKQFVVNESGNWKDTRWGQIYMPADVSKKYPVVIFFHGVGEVGSTKDSTDSLTSWGPLNFVKNGWTPDLIIFAMQASNWTIPASFAKYVLDHDADIQRLWDGSNVLWTGLSAGGQSVLDGMANNYPGAFVPMSAAVNAKFIDSTQRKVWAFHDPNDTTCPFKDVKPIYDRVNAKFTPMTGDGHGNWNKYYDPNYKENGLSIYEWFAIAVQPSPQPTGKKLLFTIKVYDDGSTERI